MEYTVHTPSFRYHDLPYQDCLNKVGTVTLQDYRDDLVALIESLNQPPLLLGHSLGFLVAQMAAKKIEIDGSYPNKIGTWCHKRITREEGPCN